MAVADVESSPELLEVPPFPPFLREQINTNTLSDMYHRPIGVTLGSRGCPRSTTFPEFFPHLRLSVYVYSTPPGV